jgi:uncharacterized SAM-binding protein YcdF (DUF218 family)
MQDVLLVLGYSNNAEDPIFTSRVDKAVELFEQGEAPQIIMSGYCSHKLKQVPESTEANEMRGYAVSQGVPAAVIHVEEQSVDTLGNFYYTKTNLLLPCSWYYVGLITTPWHMHRAQWLAEQVLGPDFEITTYIAPHPDNWSESDIKKSELHNRSLLIEHQAELEGMIPGDHEQVRPFLGSKPSAG